MIITRMVINMDESKLSTIEQIEAFLGASEQVAAIENWVSNH